MPRTQPIGVVMQLAALRADLRPLLRRRGFALTIVGIQSAAFGVALAAASLAWELLIAAMPYPHADRIARIAETVNRDPSSVVVTSWPAVRDLRSLAELIELVGASRAFQSVGLDLGGRVHRLDANFVDRDYLDLFGARPVAGRLFTRDEGNPDSGARVVLVSAGFARQVLAGATGSDAIGRELWLDGVSHVVIGILGDAFVDAASQFAPPAVWMPLGSPVAPVPQGFADDRSSRVLRVYGRIRAGIGRTAAARQLEVLAGDLEQLHPATHRGYGLTLIPLREQFFASWAPALKAVSAAGIFLIVIAIANAAALLMSRALDDRRTQALRLALGARRGHLIRIAGAEGLFVSACSGLVSVLVAAGLLASVRQADAFAMPTFVGGTLHARIAATGVIGLMTLWPAIAMAVSAASVRRCSLPGASVALHARDAGPRARSRNALMFAQIAAATVVTVLAMLLVRSSARFDSTPTGLDARSRHVATVQLPPGRFGNSVQAAAFTSRVTALAAETGAEVAVWSPGMPGRTGQRVTLESEGRLAATQLEAQIARYHNVSPNALGLLGIRVERGRYFADSDDAGAVPVAIVSESLAERLWPDGDAIGRRIRRFQASGPTEPWTEVVGVARDARHSGRTSDLMPAEWDVYYPFAQAKRGIATPSFIAAGASVSLDQMIARADPMLQSSEVASLESILEIEFSVERLVTRVLVVLGVCALVLALVGTHATLLHVALRRQRELSIRRALGAAPRALAASVVGGAAWWAVAGVVAGVGAALAVSRMLAAVLYDTPPVDVGTYAVAAIFVWFASIGAAVPAMLRSVRANPADAMRGL